MQEPKTQKEYKFDSNDIRQEENIIYYEKDKIEIQLLPINLGTVELLFFESDSNIKGLARLKLCQFLNYYNNQSSRKDNLKIIVKAVNYSGKFKSLNDLVKLYEKMSFKFKTVKEPEASGETTIKDFLKFCESYRIGEPKPAPKKEQEPKKEPKKKLSFLEELKQTDKSILKDPGNYNLNRGGRCIDLIKVSKYIIKAEKDKFKKVRIFNLSDINTDIRNVGSWELNNPTPLAIIYNYFFQLIEDEKYFIRVKNECGVKNLLFVEKAYKILLDNFDIINKKIIEQNKRYNPKIESIMKERKIKDIEFHLTGKEEPVKKAEPKPPPVKKPAPKKEVKKKLSTEQEEGSMEDEKKVDNLQDKIRKFEKNTFNISINELKIIFNQVLNYKSEVNLRHQLMFTFTFDKTFFSKKDPNKFAEILLAVLNCEDNVRIKYLTESFSKLPSKYKTKVLSRAEKIIEESCKKIDNVTNNVNKFKKSFATLKKPSSMNSYYGNRYTSVKKDIDSLLFRIGKINDFCDRVMKNYYELFT